MRGDRRGFVLVVVLAVTVLLTLACYEFADRTVNERVAVSRRVKLAQARSAALSGVDYVLSLLADPEFEPGLLEEDDRAAAFADVPVSADGALRVTIADLARSEDALWLGPASEGGKLNLNALAEADVEPADVRELLLGVPGMEESTADLILDFIDRDADPRPFGGESGLDGSEPRNLPLDTLDDLLGLPEVTAALLYGEDANRSGRLDPSEDDGDASAPPDNADGVLDAGWVRHLTVHGRESNVRPDGEPRVNVNGDDLDAIINEIAGLFDRTLGDAVEAARGGEFVLTISQGAGFGSEDNSEDSEEPSDSSSGGRVASLAELFTDTGEDDLVDSQRFSPDEYAAIYASLTTEEAATTAGRLDLNAAPVELLAGLPGFDESKAQAVADEAGSWLSPMDLVLRGLMTVEELRRAEPLLAVSSRTLSFSSFGSVAGGPVVRVDAVVDAAEWPPRILSLADLSRIGPGRTLADVRSEDADSDGGE